MGFWNRFTPLVMVAALAACDSVPTQADDAGEALFKKPPKPPDGGEESTLNPELAFHNAGALLVMNSDGSGRTEILQNDCSHSESSWAPTGDGTAGDPYRIINWGTWASCLPMRVASFDTVGGTINVSSIVEIHVVGSSDTNLFGAPAWSPGPGNEIALGSDWLNASTNEWESAIFVIASADLPSPTPELVYDPPPLCDVDSPTWNRDGSGIAFREVCPGSGQRILLVDRASGDISIVVPFGVFDDISTFDWARTSEALAVTSLVPVRRGSEARVFLLDLDVGSPQFLVSGFGPTWSPDDTQLAFHYGTKRKVQTIDVATGNVSVVGSGELPDWRR